MFTGLASVCGVSMQIARSLYYTCLASRALSIIMGTMFVGTADQLEDWI
jgi:hypothetical protein